MFFVPSLFKASSLTVKSMHIKIVRALILKLHHSCMLLNQFSMYVIFRLFTVGDGSNSDDESEFESLHTHTLYYLTQAYKNNGQKNKSAEYGHKTLQRQLSTKIYDPVDWAVNCATLSQYHLTQGDYKSAKHCLGKELNWFPTLIDGARG